MRARTLPHTRLRSGGGTRIARKTRRAVAIAAVAALGAGLLAGCADDGKATGDGQDSGDSAGKTTITLGLFGTFGYKEAGLYAEYEKLNPKIKIADNVIKENGNYYPALLNHLTTNSGLLDIQAVEVANISEVVSTQADKLTDFSKVSGVDKSKWLEWKWAQATTKDGQTVGLGTDVGPTAICYRKDLYKKAGLPTDPSEVGALWAGDWAKLVDVGERYKAEAPSGTFFMDSPGGLLNGILGSEKERFYDASGEIIYKSNPAVKAAFDLTAKAAEKGLVQSQAQFSDSWNTTIAKNKFATISCPPWMLGAIKDQSSPASAGQWAVAVGPKGGNWGGAFLAVPKSGKNVKEAQKLAAWLTAPEQQAKLFKVQGNFPSAPDAYAMPEVTGAVNQMTGDQPIGTIFAEAAKAAPVQTIGPKDQIVQEGLVNNGVILVTKGKSAQEAWESAVKTIDNKLDK